MYFFNFFEGYPYNIQDPSFDIHAQYGQSLERSHPQVKIEQTLKDQVKVQESVAKISEICLPKVKIQQAILTQNDIKKQVNQTQRKKNFILKNQQSSSEYIFQSKQHQEFIYVKQSFGRNIPSNIFRQFLKSILKNKKESIQLIQKIIKIHKLNLTSKQVMELITKKQRFLKNYVKMTQIKQFFSKNYSHHKSNQFSKIYRILMRRYLKIQHSLVLFNCSKVQIDSRKHHYSIIRKFLTMISQQN